MKKKLFTAICLFLSGLIYFGCDLADPTQVENPAITQDRLFQDATGGSEPLLVGLQYALGDAVTYIAIFTENVSDNYMNTSTFLSTINDDPRAILSSESNLNNRTDMYFKLKVLKALADFGLETVLPKDAAATTSQWARVHFYKAMSLILLAENFSAFPLVEKGPMVKAEDALKQAVDELNLCKTLDSLNVYTDDENMALARAYRLLGNKAKASEYANLSISAGQHVFYADYDVADQTNAFNLTNLMNNFTVTRPQNDMQPLPRLDFLDPKYPNPDGNDPVAVLKVEEAYMILAEVALAQGNFSEAKMQMKNAIAMALSRDSILITDKDPRRSRPNNDSCVVQADPTAPFISGLILRRRYKNSANQYVGSPVWIRGVSYTHLRDADIDALSSQEDLYSALYLLRQEIFFSEGRRMSDLGIRLPIMQMQIESNPNIHAGETGTMVVVPDYIPAARGMDEFIYDAASKKVSISYDMNRILARNIYKVSPFLK